MYIYIYIYIHVYSYDIIYTHVCIYVHICKCFLPRISEQRPVAIVSPYRFSGQMSPVAVHWQSLERGASANQPGSGNHSPMGKTIWKTYAKNIGNAKQSEIMSGISLASILVGWSWREWSTKSLNPIQKEEHSSGSPEWVLNQLIVGFQKIWTVASEAKYDKLWDTIW